MRRKITTPLKIIDSSTLPLNLTNHKWTERCKASLTNVIEHDRGQLEIFVDDKECMYVFDRDYLDYERFDRMTDDDISLLHACVKTLLSAC